MTTWFIGTNFGHGAAAAGIAGDGRLLYAVEEGRLIGRKETSRFPAASLSWVLERTDGADIVWAEGWDIWRRLYQKGFGAAVKFGPGDWEYYGERLHRELHRSVEGLLSIAAWRRRLGQIRCCGHHRAHAFSLLPVGLPSDSLVIVSDTTGEMESLSLFYWSGRSMTLLASSPFPHSIGRAFHRFARHLGFRGRTAPGKLMALSAYGEPRWREALRQAVTVSGATPRFDLELLPLWHSTEAWSRFGARQSDRELRGVLERCRDCYDEGSDLAASVQAWFVELTWKCIEQGLELARARIGRFPTHLGLAGGCALNCKANGFIVQEAGRLGLRSVTIGPWSDDPGTAIGAAAWAFAREGDPSLLTCTGPFLGPAAAAAGPAESFHCFGDATQTSLPTAVDSAVDALVSSKVIALTSGGLEFGPRALGGRCLLADPRDPGVLATVNQMKGRPSFMPLAPVVLVEDESIYFQGPGSPWMTYTVEARDVARRRIPACVHHDGSARVQALGRNDAPLLRQLLLRFKERTGESALILTSLNGAGEAIPASVDTAQSIARRLRAFGILSDEGWRTFSRTAS